MPTLLTTSKMHPDLAARVDASVRGRADASGLRSRGVRMRRTVAFARVVLALALGYVGYTTFATRRSSPPPPAAAVEER